MSEKEEPNTIFHNTYHPSIIEDEKPTYSQSSKHPDGSPSNVTHVPLTEGNSPNYGDSTKLNWTSRMEHSIQQQETERKRDIALQQLRTFAQDPNRLLEVTISTIILAASKNKVPKEHLIYTLLYLKNITDEFGDHPPNISNFIKYLNSLKKQQEVEWEKTYYADPELPTHVTKMQNPNKLSRIPRPVLNCTFSDDELKKECKKVEAVFKKKGCCKLNQVE